jgi:uncharacterized repeat protein (TIGR01451 family)
MHGEIMQERTYIMSKDVRRRRCTWALCMAAVALSARAQSDAEHIVTRVNAEVLARPNARSAEPGAVAKLQPAERVVPGDVLIYTVEVRNTGRYAVESAVVVQPIPHHTLYLADSAVGPGVDVDYSVDGRRTFDTAQKLRSPGEYTHIRWRLHNRLKPDSVAFVRFRVQVN